ncbi:hypothetical protein DH2020_004762 [Rehmannia glutinosa]|uniref:DUF4283 domain-containing protein n=1 Tax=Rehmannia glutinosa TaxID=99300 RepID=A0ABR0XQC7_REHGL
MAKTCQELQNCLAFRSWWPPVLLHLDGQDTSIILLLNLMPMLRLFFSKSTRPWRGRLTLIGKFSFAIPHAQAISKGLSSLGIKGPFSWSFANQSHIIIKLQLEEDYNRLWMGTIWMFGMSDLRILKWTPTFNPKMEAPLAPVWIRLPGLPIQFFDYHALYAISKELGSPLQVDPPTAHKTRLPFARVCIEPNLENEQLRKLFKFGNTSHTRENYL